MNVQHRQQTYSSGSFWEKQDSNSVSHKFQVYDKNRDGLLDKAEFRSLLKDVFSSQTSTQFLDDAIEETVWRIPNPDLVTATHAIDSIKDTFQLDTKPVSTPYSLSKPSTPFNAQGQLQHPPTTTTTSHSQSYNQYSTYTPTTTTTTTTAPSQTTTQYSTFAPTMAFPSQPYNQYTTTTSGSSQSYDQFNPFMSAAPRASQATTPPPYVDPHTLPPPPPLAPLTNSSELRPIPPPPASQSAGVGGGLKKPPAPLPRAADAQGKPAPPLFKAVAKKNPELAKLPAQVPAKPAFAKTAAKPAPAPLSSSGEMRQEKGTAPVRVFPQTAVGSHPSLTSVSGISEEEGRAFVEYINTSVSLKDDPDVKAFLPIKSDSAQIYQIVSEGWLLCKLLNAIQPAIIPPTQIKLHPKNAFEKIENHTLALQAARKLGCKTVNIGPEDLLQGKPRLVLGLLWQIIKRDVLSKVSLAQHPEIYKLAKNSNNLKEISDSSPEEVLIKWANHHLQRAQGGKSISNFSKDVKDGTTYTLLMNQIAPDVCNTDALREADVHKRAQMVVENAKKLKCERFVTASDIVNGNDKLNLAFVADLFNKHSGLELPTLEEMEKLKKQNSNMTSILDEAEARLRQILADGQLAHELQQEEILLYRQRKLKEQEQLAEQEAMLRSQLHQEEIMLQQQKRMKDMSLQEQEQFAREEQRKEEQRYSQRQGSSSSSSASSYSKTSSSSQSGTKAFVATLPAHSSSSSTASTSRQASSASLHAPSSSYSNSTSTYSTPSHAPSSSSYAQPAYPYSAPSSYSTSYNSQQPASTYSSTHAAYPSTYSTSAPPHPYTATPNYSSAPYAAPVPNPYNVTGSYPTDPASSSYVSTTQTVYTEPPPVASYPVPMDSPVSRRRGMFERVGKKIDRAFH